MKNPLRSMLSNLRSYSVSDDAVLRVFYGAMSNMAASGVTVTRETALRSTAVLACLIVRAETHSSLPVDVIRIDGGTRHQVPDHPIARLLDNSPNPLMHSGEFWRWEDLTEDINGNAYARVVMKAGRPVEVWPLYKLPPKLYTDKGRIAWRYDGDDFTPAGEYSAREILHFKGPVLTNPFQAQSLIDVASEAIGLSIASEQFFARLLGNGNHFPGYLETDSPLKPEDLTALREQLSGFSGLIQAGAMRIFDRGLKYKQNPMSILDADLTNQMRWQLQQICSVFRVSLAMVQDLTNGTYTNSEQQDLWLAKHTITPMCVNKERVVRHRLLADDPSLRVKFNMNALMRGDYKSRAEADAELVQAGILLPDEARAHDDLNPIPGGDKPRYNLNQGLMDADGNPIPTQPVTDPGEAVRSAMVPVLEDAVTWIRRRYESDTQRGKPRESTVVAAAEKLAPIAQAYASAGLLFDADDFITEALSVTPNVP